MDLNRIVQGLKAERDVLAAAIESLERLAAGRGRKRGRPPAWLNVARVSNPQARRCGKPRDTTPVSTRHDGEQSS
jgi:hypothetical protein